MNTKAAVSPPERVRLNSPRQDANNGAAGAFIHERSNTKEDTMFDLSGISLSDLNGLVAEEIARRKSTSRFELQAIAERHGFDLSDLVGGKASRKNIGPRHTDTRGAWGHASETVISGLQAGLHAREIADQLGWVNYGGVYTIAAKNGMKIARGRLQQ